MNSAGMIVFFGKGKVWEGVQKLAAAAHMQLTLMDDEDRSDELLSSAEQIVATPGIPPHHKLYEKYGSKIISELNFLGARLNTQPRRSNISLIGVTGTDGKSTVSHILYHALKGVLPETNIWLSGNFDEPLGFTLSEIINGGLTEKKHIIVVECSSFMLYQLESLRFDYSVRTNISPDHLNRHPDMKDYVATKYRIFTHSTKGVFTTEGVMTTLSNLSLPLTHTAPLTIYTNEYPIDKTQFVGAHNAWNLQVCYLLVKALLNDSSVSVDDETIHNVIATVQPLAHRIQLINEKSGIRFYDDSKSTSSQALKVALEAFPGPIVLIAWGSDKGDSFTALAELMKQKVSYGVFIGATGPQFIQIAETKGIAHSGANSMEEAVKFAYDYARAHGIQTILLSPGCASFGMFKDYLDRAHHFIDAVQAL